MDFSTFADKYGIPTVVCLTLLAAFGRLVWPFMASQVKDSQRRLDESQAKFLQALERRDTLMAEGFEKLRRALVKRGSR